MLTVSSRAIAFAHRPGFFQRARARLVSFFHRVAGIWLYAQARSDFNRIDAATLRDLGMTRAEFDSYWAESHGLAQPTRRRVLNAPDRASLDPVVAARRR